MNNQNQIHTVTSVIAGIAGGVLMGTIMLWMMSAYHFRFHIASIASMSAIAIALPWCMDFLKQKGFSLWVCETLTILTSCAISAFYVYSVAQDAGTFDRMLEFAISFHGLSLLWNNLRLFLSEKKGVL